MEIGRNLFNLHSSKHYTLDDCLKVFEPSPFWSCLPCREREMEYIQEFITNAFKSALPKTLVVSGGCRTGKTSAVQICVMMSLFHKFISFLDIEQWAIDQSLVAPPDDRRRLVVIDSPAPEMIPDLLDFFLSNNNSVILITEEPVLGKGLDGYISDMMNFSMYDEDTIFIILNEKLRSFSESIDNDALRYIAKISYEKNDGIDGALNLLRLAIFNAKTTEKTKVDVESCKNAIMELAEDPEIMDE